MCDGEPTRAGAGDKASRLAAVKLLATSSNPSTKTLLATWGISLALQQLVRTIFGAQNVGVENPSWMSGGVLLMGNLQLPWNRIVIIAFAATVLRRGAPRHVAVADVAHGQT